MHCSYQSTNFPEIWGKGKILFKKMPHHTLFGDETEIPDDYIQVSQISKSPIYIKMIYFLSCSYIRHRKNDSRVYSSLLYLFKCKISWPVNL